MIAPNTTPNLPETAAATPLALVEFLTQQEHLSIQAILDHFHLTPEQLQDLLNLPQTQQYIQLAEDLAKAHHRLRISAAVPKALDAFERILTDGKPETARRAANTICHLAGLTTSS